LITPSPTQQLPAIKIQRLIAYLDNVGIDARQIATSVGIDIEEIIRSTAEQNIPSIYYALIYKESVSVLQQSGKPVVWAAGLGSDAFRMLCYCIITCQTLGNALQRAQEYSKLVYPLTHQLMEFSELDDGVAKLTYTVDKEIMSDAFAPANWELHECLAVAKASGLETWFALCGWLVGRKIQPSKACIEDTNELNAIYRERLGELYLCSIEDNAHQTSIEFPASILTHRIVHSLESLDEFLETGPYQLWSSDDKMVSTKAAITSLLGNDFSNGVASFEEMAEIMHMSTSTLRRHLAQEGTSYQKIKDERRRDMAIELLCMSEKKINDVSELIGFADTSSFVRSFRSWTGVTPKVYRDQTRSLRLKTD